MQIMQMMKIFLSYLWCFCSSSTTFCFFISGREEGSGYCIIQKKKQKQKSLVFRRYFYYNYTLWAKLSTDYMRPKQIDKVLSYWVQRCSSPIRSKCFEILFKCLSNVDIEYRCCISEGIVKNCGSALYNILYKVKYHFIDMNLWTCKIS